MVKYSSCTVARGDCGECGPSDSLFVLSDAHSRDIEIVAPSHILAAHAARDSASIGTPFRISRTGAFPKRTGIGQVLEQILR